MKLDPRWFDINYKNGSWEGSQGRGQERTSWKYPFCYEEGPKKEPREKKVRPERKNEYEYNADIIDENTVIPALPKKNELIPKPDMKQYKEKEKANSHRIEEIINKKVQHF